MALVVAMLAQVGQRLDPSTLLHRRLRPGPALSGRRGAAVVDIKACIDKWQVCPASQKHIREATFICLVGTQGQVVAVLRGMGLPLGPLSAPAPSGPAPFGAPPGGPYSQQLPMVDAGADPSVAQGARPRGARRMAHTCSNARVADGGAMSAGGVATVAASGTSGCGAQAQSWTSWRCSTNCPGWQKLQNQPACDMGEAFAMMSGMCSEDVYRVTSGFADTESEDPRLQRQQPRHLQQHEATPCAKSWRLGAR